MMQFTYAAVFSLILTTPALAADLPELQRYSATEIKIDSGDRVKLKAEATGKGLKFQWINKDQVLCRESSCLIETHDWGIGLYNVILVVEGGGGSRFIQYKLQILSRKPGQTSKTVEPPLVPAGKAVETLAAQDLYIKTKKGLSFLFQPDGATRIVGAMVQPLAWEEGFKSSGGVMQFGQPGLEEHYMLTGTYGRLVKENGRRVIELNHGILRSRNLSGKAPNWSIVSGNWLQVDGNESADVIVTVGKSTKTKQSIARVIVLRGQARVLYRKPQVQPAAEEDAVAAMKKNAENRGKPAEKPAGLASTQEYVVKAGTNIFFNGDDEQQVLKLPPARLTTKVLRQTTPRYINYAGWRQNESGEGSRYATAIILAGKAPKSLEEALKQGEAALQQRDFLLALELLLPHKAEGKDHYRFQLLTGIAYRGLRLYDEATFFLERAGELDESNPEPPYQQGLLAMEFNSWPEARGEFREAESRGHPNWQLMQYYGGYSAFRMYQNYRAREFFYKSLWQETDSDVSNSARAFLAALEAEKTWWARGHLNLLFDSNVFRKPASSPAPKNIGASQGIGMRFDTEVEWRGYHTAQGQFVAGYNFSYLGWMHPDLKLVDSNIQRLYAGFGFKAGGDEGPWLDWRNQIYLTAILIGGERAADGLGFVSEFGLLTVPLQPELFLDIAMFVDPLPNRNDGLDPYTWEMAAVSDRSGNIARAGVVLTVMQDASSELKTKVSLHKVTYSNKFSKDESFTQYNLDALYNLQYGPRLEFLVDGGLGLRSRPELSQKDTVVSAKGTSRWYYSPYLSFDGWMATAFQSSSDSDAKYSKYSIGVGTLLEL